MYRRDAENILTIFADDVFELGVDPTPSGVPPTTRTRRDGRLDFVQAFVEKGRSGLWFHVAVFFGRADGTFEKPVWVERAISLADGDVTVERSLVVITPDLSADPTRRWRWEAGEHVFVDPDAEPRPANRDDDDTPDETPEQKPRARI